MPGALPTRACGGEVAVGQPCTGTHVPVKRRVQIARCFEVFGDQGGILVDRTWLTGFDRGGHAPMQLDAI